jgi:hypothetical protein
MYTKEVTGRIQQPSNKPRVKSKFIIINVPKVEYKEKVNSVKGAHRSPIEHERKAHSRRLRNGEMLELPQKTINEGNKGDNYSPEKKMYKLIKRPIHI